MRKYLPLCLSAVAVLCILQGSLHAQLEPSKWLNPLPQGDNLRAVTSGNGLWLAVGSDGTLVTSHDGSNWQAQVTPITNTLNAVSAGAGMFVAAGTNGVIIASTDGTNWSIVPSPAGGTWLCAAFGNGVFVLAGAGGAIASSADARTWQSQPSGVLDDIFSMTFGGSLFVALDASNSLASTDGKTWVVQPAPVPPAIAPVQAGYTPSGMMQFAITYGGGSFYVNGVAYIPKPLFTDLSYIRSSSDGLNWNYLFESVGMPTEFSGMAQGGNVLVGAGVAGSPNGGLTAFPINNAGARATYTSTSVSVGFGAGQFVAVGGAQILVSGDGTNWSQANSGFGGLTHGLAANSNVLVAAVGSPGGQGIQVSTNGFPFLNSTPVLSSDIWDVTCRNGQFVGVGGGGALFVSTDGINWSSRNSGVGSDLLRVAYLSSNYAAVGRAGAVITSPTGNAWTQRFSGTSATLTGVAFGNGIFVAVGWTGSVITSTDQAAWTAQYSGTTNNLNAVTFGEGNFIAVGDTGLIITSPDGVNWTPEPSGTGVRIENIIFDNGLFIATADAGVILTSADGQAWTIHTIATPINLYAICPDAAGYVVGGDYTFPAGSGFVMQLGTLRIPGLSHAGFGRGGFGFTFSGNANQACRLQSSVDLSLWSDLYRFTNTFGTTNLIDLTAPTTGQRFYRVVSP